MQFQIVICAAVFANRIDDLRLQDLAEMDNKELVAQVQEFFGDFEVIDQHHFAINIPRAHVTLQPVNWEYANRQTLSSSGHCCHPDTE